MAQLRIAYVFLVLLLYSNRTFAQTSSYPFASWMSSFPSSQNLYSKTIFDIIIPGSRASGMTYDSVSSTPALGTNHDFSHSRIESLSSEDQRLWAARQHLSVLDQLRSGSRFLDFEIEESNNDYYPYNALLTNTNIGTIINDISTFLTLYGSDEIIVLYFNSFSEMDSASFQQFYDIFTSSDLHSKMVPNTNDLSTLTLQNMIDQQYNIIAFTDDTTNAPNTFFDANPNLFISKVSDSSSNVTVGFIDEISDVRSFVSSNIRYGKVENKLNMIYWAFDIAPLGPFTQIIDYSSFFQYNMPLSVELSAFIANYPKLRFGNVILVDFIEASDVVEQTIILNLNYLGCSDSNPSNDTNGCPAQTSLPIEFKYDSVSPLCDPINNNNLDTQCQRSCGLCPVLANVPGSQCTDSADCDSILYGTNNGQCFIRDESQSQYIIQESFCLSIGGGYESCANFEGNDICRNNDMSYVCPNYCSSDYECVDGYCNTEHGICMTLNPANNTNNNNGNTELESDEKYNGVISESASRYRSEVSMFRSGDPNAAYPSGEDDIACEEYSSQCFFENLDANPYINSVLGLMLLVLIFILIFCVCFTFCCPFWCFCDKCCKNCCCAPVYGKVDKKEWNLSKEWGACLFLAIIMIIIFAFTIEGIVSNQALHSHIFDNNDQNSFLSASNRLFDDVDAKFGSANNFTEFIIDNIENILDNVDSIIGGNDINDIKDNINVMYGQLNIMHNNYSGGVQLTGVVMNPFNVSHFKNFSLPCAYCDSIPEKITNVNNTLRDSSNSVLDNVLETFNATQLFVDSRDTINDATQSFTDSISEILRISNSTQNRYSDYMSTAEEYDSEREAYVTLFFCLMFLFIIIPIIGVLLKSKWCFKINWCLAMICVILLLFISIPFIFIITLSADFCVRLDEFEQALPNNAQNTLLGASILGNEETTEGSNEFIDVNDTLQLIDTCFDGGSLLSIFNLSNILDWSEYKQQLYDSLNIDIKNYFTLNELETFQTDMSTLDINEFSSNVDDRINNLNSIPGCYCVDDGVIFNENNLNPGTDCTPVGYTNGTSNMNAIQFWTNVSYANLAECAKAFENASFAVQIWNESYASAVMQIDTLKKDSQKIFDTFDVIYEDISDLIKQLQNITCLIDPLFSDFETILNEFTNCGFLGERYGDFKKVACVTLFDDFYQIGRAIVIIAFLLVLVVLCSFCLDYVYGPWKPKHEFEAEEAEAYYVEDEAEANDNNIQLAVSDPITPISPGMTKPDGFGRVASASPRGDGDGDGNYTIPQNMINNASYDESDHNDAIDPLDEMDGAVTGNRDMSDEGNDEYPVLPNDTELELVNNGENNFQD